MKGSVTNIGLAIKPKEKSPSTVKYRFHDVRRAYPTYARMVSMKTSVLKTLFRSATHATDSTFKGCTANKPATKPLLQIAPVITCKIQNSRTTLATCIIKLLA